MLHWKFLVCLWWSIITMSVQQVIAQDPATAACTTLSEQFPLQVAFPLSPQYNEDNAHWAASSSQSSMCSIEPSSQAEVAQIIQVINATRTPWAVKGGGHAYNQGYSSTPGVQIALRRFSDVTYDNVSTVHIGAGVIWDEVYAALGPLGVNAVGGRVSGVGVAGFILGGGYSWHTQQYGLAIDNVVSFDLVTPNGTILLVTNQTFPDLFFALRGGGNNYGIVTGFRLKAIKQSLVFGGSLIYARDLTAVTDAIVNFDANNTDPKAAILATYTSIAGVVALLQCDVFLFYDGPTAPNGTFDAFLNAPAISSDVKTRTFVDFVKSLPVGPSPIRVDIQTVPIIQYTRPIVEQIINQTEVLDGNLLQPTTSLSVSLSIEPFMRSLYDKSQGGGYPHAAAHPWTPFQVLVDSPDDPSYHNKVLGSAKVIQQVAIQEGQSSANAILYNNYAMEGTALELLYGENLGTLQQIRAKWDPYNLISLTGGWKL